MSASVRLTMIDLDGDAPEVTYVLDNHATVYAAMDQMDEVASREYARTGIVPRLMDGTPYYGENDEEVVNG